MSSPDRYRAFAAYNAWANGQVYDAAQALPDADYRVDRKAFFHSLHGTLNHLLVGDRIWMHRFDGQGETYQSLGLILFEDLAELRAAREAEDARIIAYADRLDAERLETMLRYRSTEGIAFEVRLADALDHFFNHQTHHRGQAHALISAAGAVPPAIDLLVLQRRTGVSRKVGQEAVP